MSKYSSSKLRKHRHLLGAEFNEEEFCLIKEWRKTKFQATGVIEFELKPYKPDGKTVVYDSNSICTLDNDIDEDE